MPRPKSIPAGTPSFLLGMTGDDDSSIGEFWLPIDLITQTIGIVAKKRTGKSYLAKKLTEGLLDLHQQVCVIDPKGDWWGLRSSADGKHDGYPVVIFGGEHGDVPLEVAGGELVAKFVVESGTSVVLDLSHFRKHEVATFMTAFLEAIYLFKAQEVNRTPCMLVIDEADAIAPQKPQPNEARMLGAMQDIVRRGGQRGIGSTMVTQRTAVLNKDVLTQCQVLIALRTISPQDLRAMNEWIEVHGETAQQKTLMGSLPSLPVGEAWVWSPGWPTNEGIFERIQVSRIRTFDSGATPKPGEKRISPKVVTPVDLDKLRTHMAATIEQAKANDPKTLKAEIARLTSELKKAQLGQPSSVQGINQQQHQRLVKEAVAAAVKERDDAWKEKIPHVVASCQSNLTGHMTAAFDKLVKSIGGVPAHLPAALPAAVQRVVDRNMILGPGSNPPPPSPKEVTKRVTKLLEGVIDKAGSGPGDPAMKPAQKRVLAVLAQYRDLHGDDPLEKKSLAARTGYSQNSGTFDTLLSGLRTAGWLTHGVLKITIEGIKALGEYEAPPAPGRELREWWYAKITPAQKRVLTALEPGPLAKAALAEAAGYSTTSGTFDTMLSGLRTLGLLVGGGREEMRLHQDIA